MGETLGGENMSSSGLEESKIAIGQNPDPAVSPALLNPELPPIVQQAYVPKPSEETIALLDSITSALAVGRLVKCEIWLDRPNNEKVLVGQIVIGDDELVPTDLARALSKRLNSSARGYLKDQCYRVSFVGEDGAILGTHLTMRESELGSERTKLARLGSSNEHDVTQALMHMLGVFMQHNEGLIRAHHASHALTDNQMALMLKTALEENEKLKSRERSVIDAYARLMKESVDIELKRARGRMFLQAEQMVFAEGSKMFGPMLHLLAEKITGRPLTPPMVQALVQFKNTLRPEQLATLHGAFDDTQKEMFGQFLKAVEALEHVTPIDPVKVEDEKVEVP